MGETGMTCEATVSFTFPFSLFLSFFYFPRKKGLSFSIICLLLFYMAITFSNHSCFLFFFYVESLCFVLFFSYF